ncbi:MAG: ATP-grasp domain-containing protein [Planctomycetes bacterium]|nr:ATP-grasp domain-containing protein [Planctomycetota bacterium]
MSRSCDVRSDLKMKWANPKIEVRLGQMPSGWDREVIFFANLRSIFYRNQSQTQVLAERVKGLESYGGRLIPILNLLFRGRNNLLVLEAPPAESLVAYFEHHLELSLPSLQILPHADYQELVKNRSDSCVAALLKNHPARWLDGFVTDEALQALQEITGKSTISTTAGSQRGNNKLALHEYLEQNGFKVFDTYLATDLHEVNECLKKLNRGGYRKAALKSQIGASGIGMMVVDAVGDLEASPPEYYFHDGPCLVQGWLESGCLGTQQVCSPSVQLFLKENLISLYDWTDQILSNDSVHEGNISPPVSLQHNEEVGKSIIEQAQETAKWLHRQGYRGTASVDFLVTQGDSEFTVYVAEINARVTGATYPSMLACHFLPGGAWLMRNLRFRAHPSPEQVLDILTKSDSLFLPGHPQGVLPINFNMDEDHRVAKGQLLILAESPRSCSALLGEVEDLFKRTLDYDRD